MVGVGTARTLAREMLRTKDRSAHILAEYIPEAARDLFVGLRAFNLETQKVVDSANDAKTARVRLEFWKSAVQDIHGEAEPEEPVSALLHHAVHAQNLPLAKRYLLTMVQTREGRLSFVPMRSVEDMERWGEGTFSQVNYALLDGLHHVWPETGSYLNDQPDLDEQVTNAVAHLGQAAGIASLLRTFNFYARKHSYVNLPVDLMTKGGVSQQAVLDAAEKGQLSTVEGLADVVFETATRANDHILTARSIVEQLRGSVGVPPSLTLVGISALPVVSYLEHLERSQFDISKDVIKGDWKLPWRSWRAYKTRKF